MGKKDKINRNIIKTFILFIFHILSIFIINNIQIQNFFWCFKKQLKRIMLPKKQLKLISDLREINEIILDSFNNEKVNKQYIQDLAFANVENILLKNKLEEANEENAEESKANIVVYLSQGIAKRKVGKGKEVIRKEGKGKGKGGKRGKGKKKEKNK